MLENATGRKGRIGVESTNFYFSNPIPLFFDRLLLGQIDPSSASFLRADILPQKTVERHENNQ
jgi:hypothetical protein